MSSNLTQQRMTNVLLLGNLYKAHKIGKQLTQVTALHKFSIGASLANLKVNMNILKNLEKKDAENKKIKLLKDIFFQITEELEEIESKKTYPLEKYFLLESLKAEIESNEIDTSIADDLNEKKMISSTIKNLNKMIGGLDKKLNKKEKIDREQILNVLEVDEESQIKSLDSGYTAQMAKLVKDFEEYLIYIRKFKKDHGHSPNSKLVEFFESFREKLSFENLVALKGNTGNFITKSFKDGYHGEKQSRDKVTIIKTFTQMGLLYRRHDAKGEGSRGVCKSLIDYVNINDNNELGIRFWNEIFRNIHENMTEKQIKQIKKMKTAEDAFIVVWGPGYLKTKKEAEAKAGRKLSEDICVKEHYYKINKKIIDNFYDIALKSVKNSFKDIRVTRSKDKQTVKKLKGDIQKEKDLVKQIYKKHKFVEKILASRV